MSQLAAANGSSYIWGSGSDFAPEGGTYTLCWCANVRELTCDSLQSFQVAAGRLLVLGPLINHSFTCVRSSDCSDLTPILGAGLSSSSKVALRKGGCGSPIELLVSASNSNGVANFSDSATILTFGKSDLTLGLDYRVIVTADDAGYDLCWCGLESCSASDFVVPLGKLRVEGPVASQEIHCAAGQQCSLSGIQSVGETPGDRIMILTACGGMRAAVPGFPNGGVAERTDAETAVRLW